MMLILSNNIINIDTACIHLHFCSMRNISLLLITSLLFSQLTLSQVAVDEYDLLITNARIVDGKGNPWFRGSIAIKDGRVAKVGFVDASNAKQTVDAHNNIVAPGFIDVHVHTEDVFNHPAAENFIRMGVTTLVTGNCGGSTTEVAGFLD